MTRYVNLWRGISQLHSLVLESGALVHPRAQVSLSLASDGPASFVSRAHRCVEVRYSYTANSTLPRLPRLGSGGGLKRASISWNEYRKMSEGNATVAAWRQLRRASPLSGAAEGSSASGREQPERNSLSEVFA